MGYGCQVGKRGSLVALYCGNLAKLELHFPEFLPCIVLSQGKETLPGIWKTGVKQWPYFSYLRMSGLVTSLAWGSSWSHNSSRF